MIKQGPKRLGIYPRQNRLFWIFAFVFSGLLFGQAAENPPGSEKESPVIETKTPLEKGRSLANEGKLRESLPFLREAADQGSLEAQEYCALALIRLNDRELYAEAKERLVKAAGEGSIVALEEQGRLALEGGLGDKPDYELARTLLEKAIKSPEASESFYLLGRMAAEGLGRARDSALAVSLLRRGQKAGSSSAMVALGQLFLGEGGLVDRDLPQAERLFLQAFKLKNKEAPFFLGMVEERLRGKEPVWDKALEWFEKASQMGNAKGFRKMGDYALAGRGKEEKEAFGFYQTAAALKDSVAAYTMGLLYQQGRTVPRDQVAAAAWMRIAADLGHAPAQNQLGLWLLKGLGVAPELEEAMVYFEKAANQSFPPGQFNLAVLLLTGGVEEKSDERAITLLKAAAENAYPDAAVELARCYQKGKWVEQSDLEAAYWAALAGKDQRFEELAKETKGKLTATQAAELTRRLESR